jgi:transmembrane sensor
MLSLDKLLKKISEGTASDQELEMYHRWYENFNTESKFKFEANKTELQNQLYSRIRIEVPELRYNDIDPAKPKIEVRKIIKWYKYVAAIIILFSVSFLIYYYSKPQESYFAITHRSIQDTLEFGSAKLTLATGEIYDLTKHDTSKFRINNGTVIHKNDNYLNIDLTELSELELKTLNFNGYNTLQTSYGQTYSIKLSDGSVVWMNAGSSLRFPLNFDDKKRIVELSGEAYFDIVSNPNKPFVVKSRNQEILVTGTQFNIKDFDNSATSVTSLFSGAIEVKNLLSKQSKKLIPGDMAYLTGNNIVIKQQQNSDGPYWKNDVLNFYDQPLKELCLDLSRWYDVEFVLKGNENLLNQSYSGSINRSEKIEDVLVILTLTGSVKFKKEGRRIFVME